MADYFRLFQLEYRFTIDLHQLDRRYQTLQKHFHPDKHVNESQQQQQLAGEFSSKLNQGYKVLKGSLSRAQHLLSLHQPEGYESTANAPVPPALLMEQMECNERLEEIANEDELIGMEQKVADDLASIEEQLDSLCVTTLNEDEFRQAEQCISRMRFLHRLQQNIGHKRKTL